jgi:replicative DNA helicase
MSEKEETPKEKIEREAGEKTLDFEASFLGGLLITGPERLPRLTIQPHYFYSTINGKIFKTYQEQQKNGINPDIMTLCYDPGLADVDKDYISSLTNKIPPSANIQFYEAEIIKAWQTRTAKAAAERFTKGIESAALTGEIEPAIRECMGILSGALGDKHADSFITFDDYIQAQAKKEYWREYTPKLFGNLPFPDGTISAIGAAPGSGKSAALINLCRELLATKPTNNPHPGEREKAQDIDAKRKILFISAEMSTQDITDRLIHSLAWQKAEEGAPYFLETVEHTNIDYWKALKYKYGNPPDYWKYSQPELDRAELYGQVIEEYIRPTWGDRLKIAYVRGRTSFDDIYNIIINNAEPGSVVLMDYLQLMPICAADIGQRNFRYLEIRHIMDMGIIAAEKTQSVIITAAQLGREERKDDDKGDDTQGWRESGDIEQTAWNLIKLTRKDKGLSYRIVKARNSAGVGAASGLQWVPGYQFMANSEKINKDKSNEKEQRERANQHVWSKAK